MCGFVVHEYGENIDARRVELRGPDGTTELRVEGFVFRHSLLHITGVRTVQPFVSGSTIALFNGEIYNLAYQRSDGENIIPAYEALGPAFARAFDGEFAIAVYDFERRRAIFVSDPFGTKPLWVRGLSCSSYASCIGGQRLPPNTWLEVSFDGGTKSGTIFDFEFNRQHVNSFDGWSEAFERAVLKRHDRRCFIGLSSGYDSGAIASCLHRHGREFTPLTIDGEEDQEILARRLSICAGRRVNVDKDKYFSMRRFLSEFAEPVNYASLSDVPLHCDDMLDDAGAIGLGLICSEAIKGGLRIYLSGQGADEIISDYSTNSRISSFGGNFPLQLGPWPNFWGRCQAAYLCKEESVAGAFGIETRYPFLDTKLVQQFLFLAPDLKNAAYKAPLKYYLEKNGFPFKVDFKVGLRAHARIFQRP